MSRVVAPCGGGTSTMSPRTFVAVWFAMLCVAGGILWIAIGHSDHIQNVSNKKNLKQATHLVQVQANTSLKQGLLVLRKRALVECQRNNKNQLGLRDLALHQRNFANVLGGFISGALHRAKLTEKVQKGVELKATKSAIIFYTKINNSLDLHPKVPPIPKSCQKTVPTVKQLLATIRPPVKGSSGDR